jgi:hypothetical protein
VNTDPPPFYLNYTKLVPETDLMSALRAQRDEWANVLRRVPASQLHVLHGAYTWTIAQVAGHLCDTERVFSYRALRFARGDTTPLPGFDENAYALEGRFELWSLDELVSDFVAVRNATVSLFASITDSAWSRGGTASNLPWRVDVLCRAIVGHVRHHQRIVESRLSLAPASS